jgi:plastocyanin
MKRLLAVLSIVTLLAAGCGDGEEPEAEESPTAEAGPQTLPLQVGGTNGERTVTFDAFFPKTVEARPGDTLSFTQVFTGEPHTVTFGTIVDAGIDAVAKQAAPGPEPPEMQKVIDIFGPPPMFAPLNQASGQPCFLDSGDPPRVDPCPKRDQPEFNGQQSWFNSGYLESEGNFEVTLADDIEPGTYSFVCVVHRAPMSGEVTVVEEDASRPDAEAVLEKRDEELDEAIKAFQPALDQAASATPDKALAGVVSEAYPNASGMIFAPKEISIPAGGTVSWSVLSFHTISINPPPDAFGIFIKQPDGTIELNQKFGAPSKTQPGPVLFPPTPDLKPVTFDAGTYDGTGFFNSGIVVSFPPAILTYKLTFSKAGNYELRCLLHPDMKGLVKVT